jgi:hypothetical protein
MELMRGVYHPNSKAAIRRLRLLHYTVDAGEKVVDQLDPRGVEPACLNRSL